MNPFKRYSRWLHTGFPSGRVDKAPLVRTDGTTNIPGVFIVGDLTGVPLLKFAAESGARAARAVASQLAPSRAKDLLDLVIIGAGVSGVAAALEAGKHGLDYQVIEASEPLSTIVNFPAGKPIFAYPMEMQPDSDLVFEGATREELLEELRSFLAEIRIVPGRAERLRRAGDHLVIDLAGSKAIACRRVIVAIGRSGSYRKLGVPGEELPTVSNRLHDPKDFRGKKVLVVGGGDSALEAAVAITTCGGDVTLSYRGEALTRPKPANIAALLQFADSSAPKLEAESPGESTLMPASGGYLASDQPPGKLRLRLGTRITRIEAHAVTLENRDRTSESIPTDAVFTMLGRNPPLPFFRKSGIKIKGEGTRLGLAALLLFVLALVLLYDWKSHGFIVDSIPLLEPIAHWNVSVADRFIRSYPDRQTLLGTVAVSMKSRSFYYTLAYTCLIGLFGFLRIRRRRTPYVTLQTTILFLMQAIPLFLLPELLLPWLGYNGWFDSGLGRTIADHLFESYISGPDLLAHHNPAWGHPRAYWRAYGFILAFPLNVYNVLTQTPRYWWLAISFLQTFIIIPLLVYRYGKGAYCGFICSCGALAETLGDTERHRMPHGARWNRLNMLGQVILAISFLLLAIRVYAWIFPVSLASALFPFLLEGKNANGDLVSPFAWKWIVDVLLAGVVGVGLYFKYSGRVWCRFACPLAALMHIYARFSSFRILTEKKKCISCNLCTATCHQGIDIMSFANKGLSMNDPECVRCSACVAACPTDVLSFGRIDPKSGRILGRDSLRARREGA